jgi:hypothetical protein
MDLIVHAMRKGTDDQPTTVLVRLRIGETSEQILDSLYVSVSFSNSEGQLELNRDLSAA